MMLCFVKLQEGFCMMCFPDPLYSFSEQLTGPLFYGKIFWEALLYYHFHPMLNIYSSAQCFSGYKAFFGLDIHILDTVNSISIVRSQ